MYERSKVFSFIAALSLAACGGGGSGGGGLYGGSPPVAAAPAPAPSPASNLPLQETVAGSAAWVDSASHKTLYVLDVDTSTGSACTGSCLSLWPILAANAGAQGQGNVSVITRSDGAGQQWAYQGHPLYFFAGDTGPDQANGEGIPQSGGHWHVARPNASGSGSNPGSGGSGCTGVYC
jgi:predicted lipoprotein with Yx(FWY)xxD motif